MDGAPRRCSRCNGRSNGSHHKDRPKCEPDAPDASGSRRGTSAASIASRAAERRFAKAEARKTPSVAGGARPTLVALRRQAACPAPSVSRRKVWPRAWKVKRAAAGEECRKDHPSLVNEEDARVTLDALTKESFVPWQPLDDTDEFGAITTISGTGEICRFNAGLLLCASRAEGADAVGSSLQPPSRSWMRPGRRGRSEKGPTRSTDGASEPTGNDDRRTGGGSRVSASTTHGKSEATSAHSSERNAVVAHPLRSLVPRVRTTRVDAATLEDARWVGRTRTTDPPFISSVTRVVCLTQAGDGHAPCPIEALDPRDQGADPRRRIARRVGPRMERSTPRAGRWGECEGGILAGRRSPRRHIA